MQCRQTFHTTVRKSGFVLLIYLPTILFTHHDPKCTDHGVYFSSIFLLLAMDVRVSLYLPQLIS